MLFSNIFWNMFGGGIDRIGSYFSALLVAVLAKAAANPSELEVDKAVLWLLLLFAATYMAFLSWYFAERCNIKLSPRVQTSIFKSLFNTTYNQSRSFFAEELSGKIISKIHQVSGNTENIAMTSTGILEEFASLVVILAIITIAYWPLGVMCTALISLFAVVYYFRRKPLLKISEEVSKRRGEYDGCLADSVSNIGIAKAFGRFTYERLFVFKSFGAYWKKWIQERRTFARFNVGNNTALVLGHMLCYGAALYFWYKGHIGFASLIFIFGNIGRVFFIVRWVAMQLIRLGEAWEKLSEALKLLYQEHEIKDRSDAAPLKVSVGKIMFSNVDFHYKRKKELLRNFSLSIQPDEKVGLVGKSGAGKTTIVNLLARYYDIQSGTITIDRQNIAKVTQNSLRRNISVIPQDPTLFNRSIMENIRYGRIEATDDEVMEAAKKAYCHDFIMEMPSGYQSKVGERGVMVSGGERQRIAIARAILQNAPILILDEATSALDSESEEYIQKALKQLMKGKTVIAVAHRLSTLREMDRIIVMDGGRIIEDGSPSQLVKSKGAYYNFYKMQADGFLQVE
ncbi:MAG: ABC transporter ATP-binding protein/permease [Alphaproteobacteria bacterium]|nr:ABC transporter ATP-binding protein/permease [Alphaproteobacteria bacterium]